MCASVDVSRCLARDPRRSGRSLSLSPIRVTPENLRSGSLGALQRGENGGIGVCA